MGLLQVLEYMVRIWRAYVRKNRKTKRLPFILPVILHHSEAGWTAAKRFRDLLDVDPEVEALLEPFLLDFCPLFDDISPAGIDALKARAMTPEGKRVLVCFRLGRTPDELLGQLPVWGDLLVAVLKGPQEGIFIPAGVPYRRHQAERGGSSYGGSASSRRRRCRPDRLCQPAPDRTRP